MKRMQVILAVWHTFLSFGSHCTRGAEHALFSPDLQRHHERTFAEPHNEGSLSILGLVTSHFMTWQVWIVEHSCSVFRK